MRSRTARTSPIRPKSATNFALSVTAMIVGLSLAWVIAPWRGTIGSGTVHYAPLIPCAGIFLIIAASEWWLPTLRARSEPTGLPRHSNSLRIGRAAIRLAGCIATVALIGFAYWLLPEYRGAFYDPYWVFLRSIAPLAAAVPFYFLWADRRLGDARDDYLAFGSLLFGRCCDGDVPLIKRHLLGWIVKGFFLPLMTVYLSNELQSLYGALRAATFATLPLYQVGYHLCYTVDLLYCVVGYAATSRLFDAQIRSVEPTVAGWLVALMCYQPFYSVIGRFYLQYDDATYWDNWLQAWPALQMAWAALIILLAAIYASCTVSFGLRFSNLTHRGIITSGPYRFTKHPAYLSKNLSWILISVPFVSDQGWSAALRNCCLLGLLSFVYFLRARTEERHLSGDPTYVAYALWINEHGVLRSMGRAMPWLLYRAPALPPAPSASPAAARITD